MTEILRTTRDEESRKRDDVTTYQMQQQIDDLRRLLGETRARQEWLEGQTKNNEGQVVQLQMQQERHSQDVAQTLQVRQIEEGRLKQQVAELAQKVEEPLKPIRDLRAQIGELADSRRQDRERTGLDMRQIEALQGQIRQLVSQIGMIADGQRQLRDLVQELDTVNNETRQEIQRVAQMERLEEQRLRRDGAELQQIVEALRIQFTDTISRSQRIDDVRRVVMEHLEALQSQLTESRDVETRFETAISRLEKQIIENHGSLQQRTELVRGQLAAELTEIRQAGDQRTDRHIARFQIIEDRIRDLDGRLGDLPPQFDILRRRDEENETLIDALEERHLRQELEAAEAQVEDMRRRRAKKQVETAQKAGLVRNVRDALPHTGPPDGAPPSGEAP